MHVLGTPPAFILSQDQTLMFKFVRSKSVWLILPFYCCFRFLFSEISLRTFCSVWNFQGCITVYLSRCCSSYWKCFQKNFRSCRSDSLLSLSQAVLFVKNFFSFYFQASFETWLLITRSNSSVVYQNLLFVSSSFFIFFSKMITAAFTVGLQYSILPFPCQ